MVNTHTNAQHYNLVLHVTVAQSEEGLSTFRLVLCVHLYNLPFYCILPAIKRLKIVYFKDMYLTLLNSSRLHFRCFKTDSI